MAGTLRDDLLSIPGIEGADMDGDVAAPAGVRVRLSSLADVDTVSREVQRVLAAHGMRSQLTAPHVEPAAPPPPPGAADAGRGDVVALPVAGQMEDVLPRELPELPVPSSPPPDPELSEPETPQRQVPEPSEPSEPVSAPPEPAASSPQQLESVAVEEGRSGVVVRVLATGGDSTVRHADAIRGGLDAAIVEAVADIAGARSARMLGVQETVVEGSVVITVVVELADRTRRAGSAVSEGGRAYGLARAAWRALTARD